VAARAERPRAGESLVRHPRGIRFLFTSADLARDAARRRGSETVIRYWQRARSREGGGCDAVIDSSSLPCQPRTTRLILSSVKVWPPIDSTGGVLVTSTESTTPCTSLEIATDWPLASLAVTDSV
jgi:hypothetical protein